MAGSRISEYEQIQFLVGGLWSEAKEEIPYWPIEISPFSFTIIARNQFKISDSIILRSGKAAKKMKIKEIESFYRGSSFFRYKLVDTEAGSNLEEFLRLLPELLPWNPIPDKNKPIRLPQVGLVIRAARLEAPQELTINARTFGVAGLYQLKVINVSQTGLLALDDASRAPFVSNTILELSLDPGHGYLKESLSLLGKIIRKTYDKSGLYFGIHLIDSSHETKVIWSEFISSIANNSNSNSL